MEALLLFWRALGFIFQVVNYYEIEETTYSKAF